MNKIESFTYIRLSLEMSDEPKKSSCSVLNKLTILSFTKNMKKYTEEEKLSFIKQYLESGMSCNAFSRAHDICSKNLYNWLNSYGNPDVSQIKEEMAKLSIPSKEEELQNELIALRKQLKQAEKRLNEEKLKNMANELIIDLAERKYHISIRKNSDAK